MGICCNKSSEDIGVRTVNGFSSGANQISDEALEMALSNVSKTGGLKTRVNLRFSCNDLPNLDKSSKTDAFIVLFLDKGPLGKLNLGQTELIADNLNPEFATSITVDYYFEEQ